MLLSAARKGTVGSCIPFSRIPGHHLWGSSLAGDPVLSGLIFVLLQALCAVCISLSLPTPVCSVFLFPPNPSCVCLPVSISGALAEGGWGSWLVYLWITLRLRHQVPCLWWEWGSSLFPSAPPFLAQSYLFRGLPSPICLSPVSGSQNLRFSRNLRPQPRQAPSRWRTWLPLFLWKEEGEGRGRRRWEGAAPSPGPSPAVPLLTSPPPHQSPSPPVWLYKANRPLYSEAPRAGLPKATLYGAVAPLGSGGWRCGGGGSAGTCLQPEHPPPQPARLLQPLGSPTQVSNPSSLLPRCGTLAKATLRLCQMGLGLLPCRPHGSIPVGWGLQVCALEKPTTF